MIYCKKTYYISQICLKLLASKYLKYLFFVLMSLHRWQKPIGSMYAIFTSIWLIFVVNAGKYTIHGSYGISKLHSSIVSPFWSFLEVAHGGLFHFPGICRLTIEPQNPILCKICAQQYLKALVLLQLILHPGEIWSLPHLEDHPI